MAFTVTLKFQGGQSLLQKTNLILIFDKQSMDGMYTVYNPVAWKVTAFPAGGGGLFEATYSSNLAFTRAQIDEGVVQAASYYTHIKVQEQTILTTTSSTPPETYAFSEPIPWPLGGDSFLCHNYTGGYQDIGVGFYVPDQQDPDTTLVFINNPGGSVVASFTPTLSAYVVTGSWQDGKIVDGQIYSKLDGWNLDLTYMPRNTSWILEESATGFTLEIDDALALEAGN